MIDVNEKALDGGMAVLRPLALHTSQHCTLLHFVNFQSSLLFEPHFEIEWENTFKPRLVKFGHSEKDTKFEKIFHLKFDVTQ